MDDDHPFNDEDNGNSSSQSSGGFFPAAHHFVLGSGSFTNVTNIRHASSATTLNYRIIPMGDIDLRHEIRLNYSMGVVYRQYAEGSMRRMYLARIHGCRSRMTVAMYEGDNADENWRQAVSTYSGLRHPYLFQLYGIASSDSGPYAAIFHGELIPAIEMLERYRSSHLFTVYFWGFLEEQFGNAAAYVDSVSATGLNFLNCIMWIRPATDSLCIDLSPDTLEYNPPLRRRISNTSSRSLISLFAPHQDSNILASMTFDLYHKVCFSYLSAYRTFSISTNASVNLGAIILCTSESDFDSSSDVAYVPHCWFHDSGWQMSQVQPVIMQDGWTRVNYSDIADLYYILRIINHNQDQHGVWLAQANHIFNHLATTSNHEEYHWLYSIHYRIEISGPRDNLPSGYLFLCPLADLQSDGYARFRRPTCALYWSLDPSGVERLSTAEAEQHGFPDLELNIWVYGKFWNGIVYSGLRLFHMGKGFDPETQELARHLGYPLFHVSSEPDATVAQVEEIEIANDDDQLGRGEVPTTQDVEDSANKSFLDKELPQSFQFEDRENFPSSRSWKIIVAVKMMLMLLLGVSWLVVLPGFG